MFDRIDKSIPTPLYYQLKGILQGKIENGVWKLGDTIPIENDLVNLYGISRSTVRQAILALVNEGYLKREKSKGTIVTSNSGRNRVIGSLMSFTAEMNMKGISHYSKLLNQYVTYADCNLASKLNIDENEKVYFLKRVRYVNDHPFLMDEHFIPYNLVPEIENKYCENTSLYSLLLDEYHINLHHGQIIFEPFTPLSDELIGCLELTSSTNLILAERIVYSESNVAIDYFKAYINGKFSIDVVNQSTTSVMN